MIMLKGIEKTYCGKEIKTKVLKGVDLSISKGEFVCIFGESGSGKSTLLNILGLLDDATIGTYKLDGVDIRKLSKKGKCIYQKSKNWICISGIPSYTGIKCVRKSGCSVRLCRNAEKRKRKK